MFEIRILWIKLTAAVIERIIVRIIVDSRNIGGCWLLRRNEFDTSSRIEVQGRSDIEFSQGFLDTCQQDLEKIRLILEFDLRFRRMYIDID